MRWSAVLLAGCLTPLAGCTLARNAAINAVNEPREFLDSRRLNSDFRTEANAAWQAQSSQRPQWAKCADMADGFRDGYVDYLENGGSIRPPAVPPKRYQRSRYMSPEGHEIIRQYYAGFQLGQESAAASGHRQLVTLPIVLPNPRAESPPDVRQIQNPQSAPPINDQPMPAIPLKGQSTPQGTPIPKSETLPNPKPSEMGGRLPGMDRNTAASVPGEPVPTAAASVPGEPVQAPSPAVQAYVAPETIPASDFSSKSEKNVHADGITDEPYTLPAAILKTPATPPAQTAPRVTPTTPAVAPRMVVHHFTEPAVASPSHGKAKTNGPRSAIIELPTTSSD